MEKMLGELKILVNDYKSLPDGDAKIAKRNDMIVLLARIFQPEAEEWVAKIEKSPETTLGHYGQYMHLLASLELKGLYKAGFVAALAHAGANPQGLRGALMNL